MPRPRSSTTSGWSRRSAPPTSCAPNRACRTRLPPTSVRRSRDWRVSKGLAADPMDAFRQSGYLERITEERAERNAMSVTAYA